MSGHNKWASIKHKKGALDAKRGKLFTKIIREMTVAAREGGVNPDGKPRLRLVIQKAKEANMPADNIERAIKKGTGELEGATFENVSFEGYGPAGTAIIVEGISDNKNRTTSEVRSIFTKSGGNMAGAGSVSFQFTRKGVFLIKKEGLKEEDVMSIAIDAGADDFLVEEENFQVTCLAGDFDKVRTALLENKIKVESSELSMLPNNSMKINDLETAKKILTLVDELEDNDDVQNVYSNFDIPDDILKQIEE
ncbi:transcriptional regulator [Candidatus Omnitrophus magneticus]|uniref:Probable transcriptional regulatory protein OMAG_002072 n=1 Tax=Candidatus Omnitrophus magneticus TaxID=1609969 RepID=A0A0F0CL56_9BACT|nr:transcriptional regulator [Candidatus Omnitrophus magneticus]